MDPDLRALITGSSRGIGLAITEKLAASGYEVILNYAHDDERAEEAVHRLSSTGVQASAIRADVTDEEDVHRLFSSAGPIGLLVNNVGDFLFRPLLATTKQEWDWIIASNLTSTFLCCREVIPAMRKRRSGRIINIASMNAEAVRPTPNTLPYAIAKAGIVRLTKTLARTEGRFGIRVNAVAPGFVEGSEHTPPEVTERIPLRRLARPEEIADAVLFLERASYVTGVVLDVHGGAFL